MLSLTQLWLPILASAIGVFIASSLIHMVLKWHRSDYRKMPNEDEVRAALKSSADAPGVYFVPYVMDPNEFKKPEVLQKFVDGPLALVTIRPRGVPKMGAPLISWFVLILVVAAVAGYLAARTVPAAASFLAICRPVSIVAFMAFAVGSVSDGIWFGKRPSSIVKDLLDAAIYAVIMACIFAWLWPRVPG